MQHKTMKVYETLLEEKKHIGKLDIKELTKDELYTMYIIQEKSTYEIAELYGVSNEKINSKKNTYKIRLKESTLINSEVMQGIIEIANKKSGQYAYSLLKKMGIINFEYLIKPILEILSDRKKHLLSEFWKLTNGEKIGIEEEISGTKESTYYRANLCLDFLLQNEFIKEVEYKTYKITEEGYRILLYSYQENIDIITIPDIQNIYFNVKYYNLELIECPGITWEEVHNIGNKGKDDQKTIQIKEENQKQKLEITIEEQVENLKETPIILRRKNTKKKERKQIIVNNEVFKEINKVKKDIGNRAEEIIYNKIKKDILIKGENITKQVEWTSKEIGDGLGYDIKIIENANGKVEETYIEVKGTNKKKEEPFEISINEIETSKKYKEKYYLYRIGKVNTKEPEFYKVNGDLSEIFDLEAVQFIAKRK